MQCIALMLRLSHGDGSNGKFKRKSPTISIVIIGKFLFKMSVRYREEYITKQHSLIIVLSCLIKRNLFVLELLLRLEH